MTAPCGRGHITARPRRSLRGPDDRHRASRAARGQCLIPMTSKTPHEFTVLWEGLILLVTVCVCVCVVVRPSTGFPERQRGRRTVRQQGGVFEAVLGLRRPPSSLLRPARHAAARSHTCPSAPPPESSAAGHRAGCHALPRRARARAPRGARSPLAPPARRPPHGGDAAPRAARRRAPRQRAARGAPLPRHCVPHAALGGVPVAVRRPSVARCARRLPPVRRHMRPGRAPCRPPYMLRPSRRIWPTAAPRLATPRLA